MSEDNEEYICLINEEEHRDKIKSIMFTLIDFNEPYKITGFESDVSWDDDGYYY